MFGYFDRIRARLNGFELRLRSIQEALGRIESRQLAGIGPSSFDENSFKVYSQGGEDGLIQYLLRHVKIKNKIFVEFGVENYQESNTRFLLINDSWSGLVIDGSTDHIARIKKDPIYWNHNLKAECAFVTRENINEILESNGVTGDIGLLSIDIDGNDYWVWKTITVISPRIVIIEYNFRFGGERAVIVPYSADFVRQEAHYSMIYFGASLAALVKLGNAKGYAFVGCSQSGVNAFFVRQDLLGELQERTVEDAFVKGSFKESRNKLGNLAALSPEEEQQILSTLPVLEIEE